MMNAEHTDNPEFLTKEHQFELFEKIKNEGCQTSKMEVLNAHKKLLVSCVRTYFKKT